MSATAVALIMMDVLKISPQKDAYERLQIIHAKVCELVKRSYSLMHLPLKLLFLEKMCRACLKLGRAQGVAIAAAMQAGVPVTEYSPRKIKQSITGNGNADKLQVLKMLQRILIFEEDPKYFDATDALAVAVCHHFQGNTIVNTSAKKLNGWKDFLVQNPGRLK